MSSAFPPPELREITHEVAALLKERGETICVAETVFFPSLSFLRLPFPSPPVSAIPTPFHPLLPSFLSSSPNLTYPSIFLPLLPYTSTNPPKAAGGLISASLLSYPGASTFYKGGLTLYTLESRLAFGGWTRDDVTSYAGPTTDVVKGLAEHVRGTLGSTWCVSESVGTSFF